MVDLSIVMLVYQRVPQPQSTDRIPAAKLNNSVRKEKPQATKIS
jgi:hypothetical protein